MTAVDALTPVTRARDEAGHAGDFDAFVRAHLDGLLAYAVVLTGDRELAADVVQDVMVKAHARWSRIRRTDVPAAYVKRMVTNEFLSWRRRWHVRHVLAMRDDVLHARAPLAPDPAARVGDRDDLWRRLRGLPPRQRAVVVLRYYEGLADEDIASMLGMAPVTVRSTASRALAALRLSTPDPMERS